MRERGDQYGGGRRRGRGGVEGGRGEICFQDVEVC